MSQLLIEAVDNTRAEAIKNCMTKCMSQTMMVSVQGLFLNKIE